MAIRCVPGDFFETHRYSPPSNHLSRRLLGPIQPSLKVTNKHGGLTLGFPEIKHVRNHRRESKRRAAGHHARTAIRQVCRRIAIMANSEKRSSYRWVIELLLVLALGSQIRQVEGSARAGEGHVLAAGFP